MRGFFFALKKAVEKAGDGAAQILRQPASLLETAAARERVSLGTDAVSIRYETCCKPPGHWFDHVDVLHNKEFSV
jgi:hypothetical protein